MASRRRPRGPQPAQTLAEAARVITRSTHQLVQAPSQGGGLSHEQLCETGWQLAQLTGGLADTVATLALCLEEHTHTRLLRTHDGGDADVELARAARQLTTLRQALETADEAARDYYATLSRLSVAIDPTGAEQPSPLPPRGPGLWHWE